MNDQLLISIIIPAIARPLFLEKAIESILQQTYLNLEIIVVNDIFYKKISAYSLDKLYKADMFKNMRHDESVKTRTLLAA